MRALNVTVDLLSSRSPPVALLPRYWQRQPRMKHRLLPSRPFLQFHLDRRHWLMTGIRRENRQHFYSYEKAISHNGIWVACWSTGGITPSPLLSRMQVGSSHTTSTKIQLIHLFWRRGTKGCALAKEGSPLLHSSFNNREFHAKLTRVRCSKVVKVHAHNSDQHDLTKAIQLLQF